MAKEKNGTFIDDLIKRDKDKVGVGKYDNSPKKDKIKGTYT